MLPIAYIGPVPTFGAGVPLAGPRSLRLPRLFWLFRLAVMLEGECLGGLRGRSSPIGTAECLRWRLIWLACVLQVVDILSPGEIIEISTTAW